MKPRIVGITGAFGSGKTTVTKLFKRLCDCSVIDADKVAKEVLTKKKHEVARAFGTSDRKRLAAIVFSDSSELAKLNRIIHPAVAEEVKKRIKKSNKKLIILDVPLLFETGMHGLADKVIVVKCSKEKIIKRSRFADAAKRIAMQMPIEKKLRLADYVIDNNSSLKNTEEQVKKIFEEIKKDMM
ncbi:MAG: dephospho-CoA kinase [Candidatus Aenigmatarchaeota archaeon]